MISVIGVRPRDDGSACRALVSVRLDCGVVINGVRIIERADGSLFAQLPNQRDSSGAWFPVIEVPEDVSARVKDAALEAYWRV